MSGYSGGLSVDLNFYNDPVDELRAKKTELIAFCNSGLCMGYQADNLNSYGVKKEVDRAIDFCPDCSSALFWLRVSKDQSKIKGSDPNYKQKKRYTKRNFKKGEIQCSY